MELTRERLQEIFEGSHIENRREQEKLAAGAMRAHDAEQRAEALKKQAEIHAQESRTANATIHEIYQVITGGRGEPGNWHGAKPVRERIAELEQLLWDIDATARYRGDEYGVPDCIDNDGQPYQSEHLHQHLNAIDKRRTGPRASEPPCPACSGDMDAEHTCPPLNLPTTDPAPADGWVRVADELPPFGVPVWLTEGNGPWIGCRDDGVDGWLWGRCYNGSFYHDGTQWQCEAEQDDDYQPTHWHPLPSDIAAAPTPEGEQS